MKKRILSILVDNTSGVLSRVAGLFSRRGYNIDSLTVGETQNPAYSRMTVVVRGDDQVLDQIEKQVAKLEDVRAVKVLKHGERVCRELILVTVAVEADQRPAVVAIADIFRAKIVDVGVDTLMIELTGNQNKLDAFVKLLNGYEIKEMVRTGITGLSRGARDMFDGFDVDFDSYYMSETPLLVGICTETECIREVMQDSALHKLHFIFRRKI